MKPRIPKETFDSAKEFAHAAADLTEEEIKHSVTLIYELQQKYGRRANSASNLDALRDEVLTRLAEKGILATFDPAPCFHGEPPIVEFIGKVSTDPIHKYGFDHEEKSYGVRKAKERGEDYLGQKENPNAAKAKRRDKNEKSGPA